MFDDLVPITFLVTLAFALGSVAKILSDGRTRRRLIEAGAAVIATRVGGTPALIEADRSGLLAARAHALAEFAMSRMLDRIEALYHAGLEPRSRTPVRAGVAS